jgi:hypothetical protein
MSHIFFDSPTYINITNFLNKEEGTPISWNEIMGAYFKIYQIELGKVKSHEELEIFHAQLKIKKLNGSHNFEIWANTIDKFCESWLKSTVLQ